VSRTLKPVFHFDHIVTYRSIFFCVEIISSTLVVRKQRNTLRFATIRLKWKTGLKPVFHFNRIVTYRSIFFCVEVISSTLVVRKQRNTLRFRTIRLKWKTSLSSLSIHPSGKYLALAIEPRLRDWAIGFRAFLVTGDTFAKSYSYVRYRKNLYVIKLSVTR
jgi:hypothetical protein